MKKLAVIAFLALALPASAFAKGPSAALLAGPGLTTIRVSGREGGASPFWRLVQAAGFFEAAYGPGGQTRVPQGSLGPRYTITWTVPSSGKLEQDVYPYAKPSPLTYMPPGQSVYGEPVPGDWFAGGARLERALARIGVPSAPPAAPAAAAPSSGHRLWPVAALAVLALAVLALAGAVTTLRRRSSGAAGI